MPRKSARKAIKNNSPVKKIRKKIEEQVQDIKEDIKCSCSCNDPDEGMSSVTAMIILLSVAAVVLGAILFYGFFTA